MEYKAVATCMFGLESIVSFEVKRQGAKDVTVTDGRITFSADGETLAKVNVNVRTAERVLIILSEFSAKTFDELFDNVKEIPFKHYIEQKDAFPVKGYTMNSVLSSVPACQSIIKKAIVERLKSDYNSPFLTEKSGITKKIQFSIVKDHCTIMLDTSGDGLHKRGYRPLLNVAPIKETLGAGICDFARVFPESRVVDPFCGSGTLVIEAALRASGIAPGLTRKFAGENYGFLGNDVFEKAKTEARAAIKKDVEFCGMGFDINPEAVEVARENAKRAGVSHLVTFEVADALELKTQPNDIIITNPPYGERLMSEDEAELLYKHFSKNLETQSYKGLYLITNHPEFEKIFGKKANKRRKLYNGMIPCQLYMYF